jgi:hypothetical protein
MSVTSIKSRLAKLEKENSPPVVMDNRERAFRIKALEDQARVHSGAALRLAMVMKILNSGQPRGNT